MSTLYHTSYKYVILIPEIFKQEMIKVSVIIPTWRNNQVLNKCLKSLFAQNYPPSNFEIILVSKNKLAIKNKRVSLIKIGNQINHAEARNIAAKYARGKILAFCDDDCVLPKDWITKATICFKKTQADLIGGPIIPLAKAPFSCRLSAYLTGSKFTVGPSTPRWRDAYPEGNASPFHLILANNFVTKKAFKMVGGFAPDQVPCEENLFYYRLKNQGFRLFYTAKIACFHPAKPIFLPYAQKIFFYSTGRGMLLAREEKTFHPAFIIPSLFVISLLILITVSPFLKPAFLFLIFIMIVYWGLNFAQAFYIFLKRERNINILWAAPMATLLIHLSYGLGVLNGFVRYKLGKKNIIPMPNAY